MKANSLHCSSVSEDSASVSNVSERCAILAADKHKKICCSVRYMLAVLTFFGYMFIFAQRANVSIAIVKMVNDSISSPGIGGLNRTHSNSTAQHYFKKGKVYDWSFDTQGWILSAFFYGYPVFQIPAGFFADRVGGKLIVGVGALVSAVCTLLIPLAADLGASYVIALRFLAGLAESTILPAVTAVWSKWAPPLERSTLLGIVFSGTFFGVAVSLPLSGTICYYLGWTYSFYIIGACGVAWCLLWFGMASDTPETHRTISDVEREYIITSLHGQISPTKHDIPWRFMMKSCAVWAIVMTYWSCCWTFFTFMTLLPTYMKEVLQFGVQKSGLSSALPFLASWFSQTVVGRFADYLTESQNFSVTAVRKGCIVIGLAGSTIFMVATGYVEDDYRLAMAFVTISIALLSCSLSGIYINCLDIAPKYGGIIYGITNTFSTIPGMVGPVMVKHLTQNHTSKEWQKVFWIFGGFNLFGSLFFAIFGKAEVQPWAAEKN